MAAVHGTYQDGKIILDGPADWPDGTRVVVEQTDPDDGLREEDWDDSPEGVAAWIAWLDSLQPFLSPEEEEAWKKALAEQKAFELSKWEERRTKLEKLFE